MAREMKNCIECFQLYQTNHFAERSKFCSKKCMYAYKGRARRERQNKISHARVGRLNAARAARKRQALLQQKMNRSFEANDNQTYRFGDDILTLKNYKRL